MKKFMLVALLASSLLLAKEYQMDQEIPPQYEPYLFGFAKGLAVRSNGDIYAAGRRIHQMNASEHVLYTFPATDGHFEIHADGLAADPAGNVFAMDEAIYRVVKYGPGGNIIWAKPYMSSGVLFYEPIGAYFYEAAWRRREARLSVG
jgi:hypothetical protein